MLVDGDGIFLGMYAYLIDILTCLSDITLSTSLKLSFNSSIASSKLKPSDFQIKQKWFSCIFNVVFL